MQPVRLALAWGTDCNSPTSSTAAATDQMQSLIPGPVADVTLCLPASALPCTRFLPSSDHAVRTQVVRCAGCPVHASCHDLITRRARRSYAVLAVDVRYLALSLPGSALPTDLLTNCRLPTVEEMVFDSLHGMRLFKDARDSMAQPAGDDSSSCLLTHHVWDVQNCLLSSTQNVGSLYCRL